MNKNEMPDFLDKDIDTSEIPELDADFFAGATLTRPGEDLIGKDEMPLWWFAGQLLGMVRLANDETLPSRVREIMRRALDDLLMNWTIGDKVCRRISKNVKGREDEQAPSID